MIFNTNTLGYKLYSGKLKERRVHSEQLGKFVAGLFDSDGSVTARHRTDKPGNMKLSCEITQANSVDTEGKMLKALCDFYEIGHVRYKKGVDAYVWECYVKDTKKFFNLIGKHLVLKKEHFRRMIEYYDTKQFDNIELLRKQSRLISATQTHPKHIGAAYLAGLICGDGYICAHEQGKDKKAGSGVYKHNTFKIDITLHESDRLILEVIKKDYGGKLNYRKGLVNWSLALGRSSTGSFNKIKKIEDYLLLDYKYESFNTIKKYHKQLAETKRLRPDKGVR